MDASQRVEQSLDQRPRPNSILSPQRLGALPAGSSASVLSSSATANNNSPTTATTTTNASQNLVISSNDDFHWCAEMDYQFGQCDNSFRSTHSQRGLFENTASQISFTSNSDSSVSAGRYHKNFDIHLAQIDIETFTSEDIERISHNSFSRPMEDSADTLRIVESLRSLNVANGEPSKQQHQQQQQQQHQQQQLLQLPSDDCEALSVDSLDLSLDNEINAQLIQKCSERDKTRYKIAMIDTSVHSQMQNSAISTHSDIDCVLNNHPHQPHHHHHHNNNNHHNAHHPTHHPHHQQNRSMANGPAANLQLNLSRRAKSDHRCSNPFIASLQQQQQCDNSSSSKNSSVETLQSPGSLVQMFIQNKIGSNENSAVLEGCYPVSNGNYLNESLSKCDMNGFSGNYHNNTNNNNNNSGTFYGRQLSQGSGDPLGGSYLAEDPLEQSAASNSLNTVDSNELPLHVLDLSKKLRSMNLNKQTRFGSTSASSNTSYTSTTTSSSAATFDRRKTSGGQTVSGCSTNPFLQTGGSSGDKRTRTTSTQFPEMFQDKEVQASFEEDESKDAPVLVYYPNYSLPDLSFLQDIFRQDSHSRQPIYLSPVKHEPPKMAADGGSAGTSTAASGEVKRRVATGSSSATTQRKCRPKSYTDYETLLSQDLCEIKDWDSLNLLLPDDFREFIEKNNLLRTPSNSSTTYTSEQQQQFGQPGAYPIRTTIPNSRAPHSVKMRSHARREQPSTKRYSLQEAHYDSSNQQYYYQNNPHLRYYQPTEGDGQHHHHHHHHDLANQLNMTRSQTMPNCQAGGFQAVGPSMIGGGGGPYCPPPPPPPSANYYQHFQQQHQHSGNPCCGHACCHSGCHSPSFHSSQNSPSSKPPNFNWEMLSSSRFQKLLSFLSKLDECAPDHSDHSTSTTKADTQQSKAASHNNSITTANEQRGSAQKRANRSSATVEREQAAVTPPNRTTRPSSMRAPSRLEHKSKTVSTGTTTPTAAAAPVTNKQQSVGSGKVGANLLSKATSPMSTNREVASRRSGNAAPETSKTKIILKRPTTLKNHGGGGGGGHSGIPVPKRTSSRSMIPTPLSVGLRHSGKESTRTKERLKGSANSQF